MKIDNGKIKIISLLSDVLGIFSFLVTVIPIVFAIVTGISWLYILGGVFAVSLILVSIYRKRIAKYILKKIMNLTCPDKMYKLKKKEVIYEFITREKMRHEKNFDVEVLHDGFIGIDDKFKWTGDGELIPKAKYDTQEVEILDRKFGMQRYRLKFKNAKCYSRHDNIEKMSMIIDNIDDSKKMSSLHLSSGIFEITDCLVLHLIFGNGLKPKNIRFLEYIHYSDDEHYNCYDGTFNFNDETGNREIIWEIEKPFFGGKYMIDWTFD